MSNLALLTSLKGYLHQVGANERSGIPGRFSVWYDNSSGFEITLLDEVLVDHVQSIALLDEAIYKIAKSSGFSLTDFKYKLINFEYDSLKVRASGEKIDHGKINFNEGLEALTGLYKYSPISFVAKYS